MQNPTVVRPPYPADEMIYPMTISSPGVRTDDYFTITAETGIEAYHDAIENLWKNNIAIVPPGRFKWFYSGNPVGTAVSCLARYNRDEALIGMGSLYPRRVVIRGRTCRAGVTVDFAIDKRHRVLGPAVKIQRVIAEAGSKNGFQFNYAYPNAKSKAVFSRVGYANLGEARNFVKFLRTEGKIAEFVKIHALARLPGLVVDQCLRLLDLTRMFVGRRKLVKDILDRCDERFDALWEGEKAKYPIIGDKSASFLNWRYADNGVQRYRFFCLFNSDRSVLKGYVAYAVTAGGVARIYDMLAADTAGIRSTMLLRFAEQMRREGVSFISLTYFGSDEHIRHIKDLDFYERRSGRSFFVLCHPNNDPSTAACVTRKDDWFLFGGDLDLE